MSDVHEPTPETGQRIRQRIRPDGGRLANAKNTASIPLRSGNHILDNVGAMDAEALFDALAAIWDQLPTLVGTRWATWFTQIRSIVERLDPNASSYQTDALVHELLAIFRDDAGALEALSRAMAVRARPIPVALAPLRGADRTRTVGHLSSRLVAWLRGLFAAERATRYVDISAPRQLRVGERAPVVMTLRHTPIPDSQSPDSVETALGPSLEFVLHILNGGLESLSPNPLLAPFDTGGDIDPLVFYIRGIRIGPQEALVEIRQGGVSLGITSFSIDVVESGPATSPSVLKLAVEVGGNRCACPDLEFAVDTRRDGDAVVLHYRLHSPNGSSGFHHHGIPGPRIEVSLEEYRNRLFERLEALGSGQDLDGQHLDADVVTAKLTTIGRTLFRELFPADLRNAYRTFRNKVRTVQITSDEPWIPWELVHPYDDEDPDQIIDDDFWCVRFELTRWLSGRTSPSGTIDVAHMACIEAASPPGQAQLPFAVTERQYLQHDLCLQGGGIVDHTPMLATWDAVSPLLDGGGLTLWHFAAHGDIESNSAQEAMLILADGHRFRAEDLAGPRQTQLSRDRPLVFLNACRTSRSAWTLTGHGGWAPTWVTHCRCGAFVAPMWSIGDRTAYEFARAFYDSLRAGQTIGSAARNARLRTRELRPADPTWLAYTVYAQPNSQVRFGAKASPSP